MLLEAFTRIGLHAAVACGLWLGGGGVGGSGGGSASGTTECNVDAVRNSGSAECKRNGSCGGAECCYVEYLIPPYDTLVKGDKRILATTENQGWIIFRKCDPPVRFLGLEFGWWTCEEESRTPLKGYFIYSLIPCPDEPKSPSRLLSGGGGE